LLEGVTVQPSHPLGEKIEPAEGLALPLDLSRAKKGLEGHLEPKRSTFESSYGNQVI